MRTRKAIVTASMTGMLVAAAAATLAWTTSSASSTSARTATAVSALSAQPSSISGDGPTIGNGTASDSGQLGLNRFYGYPKIYGLSRPGMAVL